MQFTDLSESGLGVTHEEVADLFKPFVTAYMNANDPAWSAEMRRRRRKISRKYLGRRLLGWMPSTQRRENTIIDEYSKAWQESEYAKYNLSGTPPRISPWEWRGKHMLASDVGATRFRQLLIVRLIEQHKPRQVLEVGCGNGINLILLASRFPDIRFTGVELTQQGHRSAVEFQKQARLPQATQDYAPLALVDPLAFRNITFLQGNATDLPFKEQSFDLVMTVLALEQMERVRDRALCEIARVCKRYLLNIEPFRDVNDRGWPRKNIVRRNYFQGRITDMLNYGVEPKMAINDFPQEAFLKTCALLSEKRNSKSP